MIENVSEFRELVKDALTHLYDVGHLQAHPLAEHLRIPEDRMVAGGKARALRQVLFDAIEALRSTENNAALGRNQRSYKLLYHRYIEGTKAQEVALLLALSDRQYFRELDRAIDEISQLLAGQVAAPLEPDPTPSASETGDEPMTVASEALRISQQEKERWFDLWEVVQGLVEDLSAVLNERQTTIRYAPGRGAAAGSSQRIPIFTNRTLLRQLLLFLFLEVSGRGLGVELELACAELPDAVTISLTYPGKSLAVAAEHVHNSVEFTGLLAVINARLDCPPGRPQTISIFIPTSRWNILIVDDNNATVRLFRRFLATENCRIFDAPSVSKAVQFLKQTSVSIHLIIMDVMMPNQDGWEGLQKLHTNPAYQHIPVVICSVLNQPDLAVSLGAAGFLAKPVKQHDLVAVVQRFLYDAA